MTDAEPDSTQQDNAEQNNAQQNNAQQENAQQTSEGAVNNAPVIYVGFWARFVAFLIDSTVASLIMSPLVVRIIGEIDIYDYNLNDTNDLLALGMRLSTQLSLDILFMGTLFILFWVFRNATPGKMLFKCVIVDAKTLAAPTVMQNIGRYFAYYLSLMPVGLGFFWIGFDAKKQGWHDKLAGTVVIKGHPRKAREQG